MMGNLYVSYNKASLITTIIEGIPQDDVIDTICGQIFFDVTSFHVSHINSHLTLYLVRTEENERHFFFSTHCNQCHVISRIIIYGRFGK